jgi:hypothetical protein
LFGIWFASSGTHFCCTWVCIKASVVCSAYQFLWLFSVQAFCWAKLNHRTLLSPPPPNLETIATQKRKSRLFYETIKYFLSNKNDIGYQFCSVHWHIPHRKMAGALLFDRQVTLKASLNHRAATACSCYFRYFHFDCFFGYQSVRKWTSHTIKNFSRECTKVELEDYFPFEPETVPVGCYFLMTNTYKSVRCQNVENQNVKFQNVGCKNVEKITESCMCGFVCDLV